MRLVDDNRNKVVMLHNRHNENLQASSGPKRKRKHTTIHTSHDAPHKYVSKLKITVNLENLEFQIFFYFKTIFSSRMSIKKITEFIHVL